MKKILSALILFTLVFPAAADAANPFRTSNAPSERNFPAGSTHLGANTQPKKQDPKPTPVVVAPANNPATAAPVPAAQVASAADVQGLREFLAKAKGGETLRLAEGNYGTLSITRKNFTQPVTIIGGTFDYVYIGLASNIVLRDMTVHMKPTMESTNNSQAMRIVDSSNLLFSGLTVKAGKAINGIPYSSPRGTPNPTGNVIGLPFGKGMNFYNSFNIRIENSELTELHKGITVGGPNMRDIAIVGNHIHHLRGTPISGTSNNMLIDSNRTHDSTPWQFGGTGDHGDLVHIWTNNAPLKNITITNNDFSQGEGEALLGIYLDDNNKDLGFENTLIANNRIENNNGQGMRLEKVAGIINGNILKPATASAEWRKWPRIVVTTRSHDLLLSNNTAADIDLYKLTVEELATIRLVNNTLTNVNGMGPRPNPGKPVIITR